MLFTSSARGADSTFTWNARDLYESSVSHHVQRSPEGDAVTLESGRLYEDDGPAAGYSYKPNQETLNERVWIKKDLVVERPQARGATLLLGVGGRWPDGLKVQLNGHQVATDHPQPVGKYWQALTIDPRHLRICTNEIVLSGDGSVWIARDDEYAGGHVVRTKHPNRSGRSSDGGITWDYDHLGRKGDIDGEYYVRLALDQFQPEGSLELPVIDVADPDRAAVGPHVSTIGPVEIQVVADTSDESTLTLWVRTGSTPVLTAEGWSGWQALGEKGGTIAEPHGRYLQVSCDLTAIDPLQTPRLKEVRVKAQPNRTQDWTQRVKRTGGVNPPIVRTTIPFRYEPFQHSDIRTLRERYDLDKLVAGAKDELELMTRLARWSSSRWDKGHLAESYPAWNALAILDPHQDGRPVGGFCQQYNLVFLQACESFGLVGRAVSLGQSASGKPAGGGHEVVELWSNQFNKWIYVDGNCGWYAVDKQSRTPLSLLQLRERQLLALSDQPYDAIEIITFAPSKYTWPGLTAWPPFAELRLIPRSNFLEQASPLPLNQGMRGWFWTGHYVWTDERSPAALLYGNRVSKRSDFEWSLNQVHYVLEATAQPGRLRVHLDTETPGLATLLARIDNQPEQSVAASFDWTLHKGKNRLEVRAKNVAGRAGSASWVELAY